MGRLIFEDKKLVYSDDNYSISKTLKHMFSSIRRVADYALKNDMNKVIFVLRHSIRPRDNWSDTVKLTPLGVHAAEQAGKALSILPDEMSYYSTNITRTKQTAYYIALGRHIEYVPSIRSIKNINTVATDLNYIKNSKEYNNLINTRGYNRTWYDYMYDGFGTGTAFNDINEVSYNFVSSVLTRTTTKNNILISHDQNVMPLVVQTLNKLIDFRVNYKWLNFLSGIAILEKDGIVSVIPVTGLVSGYNV